MRPKVGEREPSRADIERLLDAAVRAPSHHLTQPWRFYVLTGAAKQRLANAIAAASMDSGMDAESAHARPS